MHLLFYFCLDLLNLKYSKVVLLSLKFVLLKPYSPTHLTNNFHCPQIHASNPLSNPIESAPHPPLSISTEQSHLTLTIQTQIHTPTNVTTNTESPYPTSPIQNQNSAPLNISRLQSHCTIDGKLFSSFFTTCNPKI